MGKFSTLYYTLLATMVALDTQISECTKVPPHHMHHPHHDPTNPAVVTTYHYTQPNDPSNNNQAQFYTAHQQPNPHPSHTHIPSRPTNPPPSTIIPASHPPPPPTMLPPGSNRNPHHLPFFAKKVNKIANKFSKFFNELFHGHHHHHNKYEGGGRGWYPNNRPYYPPPQRPQYYPHHFQARSDFDHYGSCKYGPCHSVQHALDSFFIRDGFGHLIRKFHHHHH